MKRVLLASFLSLMPVAAQAAPLTVVNVSAPAINCVFTTAVPCTVTVNDTVGAIPVVGGRLQSRTYVGKPGSAASGLTAYVYRVDLTSAVGITARDCIDRMAVQFARLESLDFNGDRRREQVFVVTGGGLGTIGLASADKTGNTVTFRLQSPVCQGSAPGRGATSFFFGVVSRAQPRNVTAILHSSLTGASHPVPARSAP
jgi:hypothetical protein